MRKPVVMLLVGSVCVAAGVAQDTAKAKPEHTILTPTDIKWGDGPPSLPAGAQAVVLDGDPKKEGIFHFRLKLPAGYRIPPHWHPADERVTVLSGTFNLGLGSKFDDASLRALPAGSFFSLPTKTHHFALVKEETVIQLSTIGPWGLTYVNAEDDPRNRK